MSVKDCVSPVCVTPVDILDKAHEIASRPEVVFCSFGDMLRVPGSRTDLYQVKARGGDVRVIYSPLDAVKLARENPEREIVFFGIGFETTAPANGMAVWDVRDDRISKHGAEIGELDFVSHCYRRPRRLPVWPYNLFTMVHGRDRGDLVEVRLGQPRAQ